MGVDWYRMRPRSDDWDTLRTLCDETRDAYWRYQRTSFSADDVTDSQHYAFDLMPMLLKRYPEEPDEKAALRTLQDLKEREYESVDVEEWDPEAPVPHCHRISPIGYNHHYPAEWRIESYRSFLPDEVAPNLKRWREHITRVRAGAHRGYFLECYLYFASHKIADVCRRLREDVEMVKERQTTWAARVRASTYIADVENADFDFPLYPFPEWKDWEDDTDVYDVSGDERLVALYATIKKLRGIIRNRNYHTPSRKTFRAYMDSFEAYIGDVHYDFLDALFDWLEKCIDDGMGLCIW